MVLGVVKCSGDYACFPDPKMELQQQLELHASRAASARSAK